jgi:hypothetical protein
MSKVVRFCLVLCDLNFIPRKYFFYLINKMSLRPFFPRIILECPILKYTHLIFILKS